MAKKKETIEAEGASEINEQMVKDLETLKAQVFPNVEDGSLLVVTVGNDKTPATKSDMERVAETVNELFEGVNGIKVMVIPHQVNVENLPLPALRNLQSKVVSSWSNDSDIVVDLEETLGIMGGL